MRRLHIIMPMGGEASRFKNIGINIPKPLIKANGIEFFKRAIYGIKKFINDFDITFIVRKEHIDNYNIDKALIDFINNANIKYIDKTTRGSVETCLLAKDKLNADDGVLILDCDLEFSSEEFVNTIYMLLNDEYENIDGLLLSFTPKEENKNKYSYAEIDNNGNVIRTAEKNPISNNALMGAYYFNNASMFIEYANKLINENDLLNIKEFYTSLIFNYMIKDNKKIKLIHTDNYNSFGTPEELKEYESNNN